MSKKEMAVEEVSEAPVEDISVETVKEETATVEETPTVELTPIEEIEKEEAPVAVTIPREESADNEISPNGNQNVDYLNPDLFSEIRSVTLEEINEAEVNEEITDSLKEKYSNSLGEISEHELIKGRVIGMNDHVIFIDIGFKSEGIINRDEFTEETLPKIGDQIEIYLERLEDRRGNMVLSKEKADFMRRWKELKDNFDEEKIFTCKIERRIKGGMVVDLNGIQGFLPGSQIDVRPVKDFDSLLDTEVEIRIVKLNEARKNIVVSHKVIIEDGLKEKREALLNELEIGSVLEGRVKNITDFGVFVDLGGVDGLLHITDISWGRINHPSEIVNLDDELTVKIIDFDHDKQRVSLGLKQLTPHPWEEVEIKYPVRSNVHGKIVSMTNYGAFIEIEPGVEGLIHVSEMSWTRHIKNPNELYKHGDEVDAMVLSIDSEERKISLGVKQLEPDPWDEIEEKYEMGSIHKGTVNNLAQYGAFIELEKGIDGLAHVSDLSWTKVIRHPKEILENGQEIEVKILEISRVNRRISLGIKQVSEDPWPEIIKYFEAGKEVTGDIIRVLDKGIIFQLEMEVEGIIPFGKMPKRKRKEVKLTLKQGDSITGIVMEVKSEEKKVVLFSEKFANDEKKDKQDDVKDYLKSQKNPVGEKIEIPNPVKDSSKKDTENDK